MVARVARGQELTAPWCCAMRVCSNRPPLPFSRRHPDTAELAAAPPSPIRLLRIRCAICEDGVVARTRKPATTGDLVKSLALILIPLVVITVLFTKLPRDHPVKVVDWRPVLATAREQSPYQVLAPTNLPSEWRATSVTWVKAGDPHLGGQPSVRNLWQLGFLSPDDVYIAVAQGDLKADDMVTEQTRTGALDGQSTVKGEPWQRRVSPDDRTRSLVRVEPTVTTVVVGDTSYTGLEAFAATLSSS
jgi:hypothetical protein